MPETNARVTAKSVIPFTLSLAIALSAATACGASSAAESMAVFSEIAAKGTTIGKDVDEYVRRNNPEAAIVVLSRHMREVDAVIDKVERDRAINDSHKLALLKQLRGYRSDLAQSRNNLRAMVDLQQRWRER